MVGRSAYGDINVGQHWLRQWLGAWDQVTFMKFESKFQKLCQKKSIWRCRVSKHSYLMYWVRRPKFNAPHKLCWKRQIMTSFNTLRPRQNGQHFADNILKCIFLNENVWIPVKISLNVVPKGPINNIPALVQIMAWRCPGDKPLSDPMVVSLFRHIICVTRSQWVKNTLLFKEAEINFWRYTKMSPKSRPFCFSLHVLTQTLGDVAVFQTHIKNKYLVYWQWQVNVTGPYWWKVKSTLVQEMAWYSLSQCWPRSMWPYGFTRPQWFNLVHGWPELTNMSTNNPQ